MPGRGNRERRALSEQQAGSSRGRRVLRGTAIAVGVFICLAAALICLAPLAGHAGDEKNAADLPAVTPPVGGENLDRVRGRIRLLVEKIQTVTANVEMSKVEKKKDGRRTKSGPLELARGHGARLSLTRKTKTEEYIARPEVIWAYDHHDKEAQSIPTSLPVIRDFVQAAMRLDLLLAMDPDTVDYEGTSNYAGEQCWVLVGKSPGTLKAVGVPVVKMRVWISQRDGVPRLVSIPSEKDLRVELNNVALNGPVTEERLTWKTPKGVRTKNMFGF